MLSNIILLLNGENVVCFTESMQENCSVRGNVCIFVFLVTPAPILIVSCPDAHRVDQLLQVGWDALVLSQPLEHLLGCLDGVSMIRLHGSVENFSPQKPSKNQK